MLKCFVYLCVRTSSLWLICMLMLLSDVEKCQADVTNSSMSYEGRSGPLCWGPGIWPHPQHCRLFTVCVLKYEVRGTLFVCPSHTGFSAKHLKCVPDVLVPMCQNSTVLGEAALQQTSAHQLVKTDVTKGLCDVDTAPYCLDEAVLVVCGPNNSYIGSVNCTNNDQSTPQGCDLSNKACASTSDESTEDNIFSSREEIEDLDDSVEMNYLYQPSKSVPSSLSHQPLETLQSNLSHQTLDTLQSNLLVQPVDTLQSNLPHQPLNILQSNLSHQPLETLQSNENTLHSNLSRQPLETLQSNGNILHSNLSHQPLDTLQSNLSHQPSTPLPNSSLSDLLPPAEEIICRVPGLQCHDSITIMDCPTDGSTEPTFVMSCANIISATDHENATGYCDVANATCVLAVEQFTMNVEIATLDFGEAKSAAASAMSESLEDDLDMDFEEDEEGPELYDSDMLRESSAGFGWDSLSWFRNSPNVEQPTEGGKFKDNAKIPVEFNQKDSDDNKPSKTLNSIVYGNTDKLKSKQTINVASASDRTRIPIKIPAMVKVPSGNDEALSAFLEKCNRGGLYCLDNSTLVACSGDADSDMYAIRCRNSDTVSRDGKTLQAYCDVTNDSCVVDVRQDGESVTSQTSVTTQSSSFDLKKNTEMTL